MSDGAALHRSAEGCAARRTRAPAPSTNGRAPDFDVNCIEQTPLCELAYRELFKRC
jgi:hypothetical protein